MRIVET